MRKIVLISAVLATMLVSLSAESTGQKTGSSISRRWGIWDGHREGFLLGLGFGVGYDAYSEVQYDSLGPGRLSDSSIAFAASPRIGYAFNDHWAVMYARNPLTYSVEGADGDDVQITVCTEALQCFYYFKDSAPSLYVGGGAGIGYFFDEKTFNEPAMNYSEHSLKGIGVYGVVGFEPIRHVSAELAIHFRSPQEGASDMAVSLLVGVLGY
jgi:hypothetical protein